MASNTPAGIQPFQEFLNSVHSGDPARTLHGMSDAVANESAVADMRTHVLRYYEGVEAEHSFVDENGSIFDCVPIERQPSLRRSAEPVPTAPDLPTAGTAGREAIRVRRSTSSNCIPTARTGTGIGCMPRPARFHCVG